MDFRINAKSVIFLAMASFGLTLATFFSILTVDRTLVEKNFPPYVSATVEGRGWPAAYIVDDPKKEKFEHIGAEDRVFFSIFLFDWAVLLIIIGALYYALGFLKVSYRGSFSDKGSS